jgi:hypothetical protein
MITNRDTGDETDYQEILDILKNQARALEERPNENIDARQLDRVIEFVEKLVKNE